MTWVEPPIVEDPSAPLHRLAASPEQFPLLNADDPLVRLMDACESATDSYANALHLHTAAEIAFQRAWDDAYRKTRPTVRWNTDAERAADAQTRDLWAAKKECEASEKEWDKRLRAALARLSAMQTYFRGTQAQT